MNSDNKAMDFLILEGQIVQVLKTIYDPEIPVDIYELGMIYEISVDDNSNAKIVMTLTSPNCPVAESMPQEVREKVASIPNINEIDLQLTFEPPWTMEMMSDEAKLELGMM
ncbi:MAG: FeS assembly SUF system protein [Bacteroidetes bacterium CG2_30_33_31]|nr:MAG: FeS assembly SUF system protein [Bacteroidetes bacterium CG2_30_33_31]